MTRVDSPLLDRMIFVVGARRSGTNWVQRALAAHPDVVAVPSETYLFSEGLEPLRRRFHHGAAASSHTGAMHVDRGVLLDAMRAFCDAVFMDLLGSLDPRAARLVERTPDHVRCLGLIGDVYPDAHVVHIVRDGRDVVRSLLSHEWGPADAAAAAEEWRSAVETARTASAGLPRYVEVRYEEMLADPEPALRTLLERLGLRTTDGVIGSVVAEAGARYNVDPGAPQVAAGKWREGLSPEAQAAVSDVAGGLLASLGYEQDTGVVPGAAAPARARPRRRAIRRAPRRTTDVVSPPEAQRLLDRFLEAARTDAGSIRGLLAPGVRVRVVDGDSRFEARGDDAVARLVETLRADDALRGRQTMGYVHPSVPAVTFVGEFTREGLRAPRVIVLTVQKDTVTRVAYYRLPEVPGGLPPDAERSLGRSHHHDDDS